MTAAADPATVAAAAAAPSGTVRVHSTDPASQGPWVLIDAARFDPQRHRLWQDDAAASAPPHEAAAAPSQPAPPARRARR